MIAVVVEKTEDWEDEDDWEEESDWEYDWEYEEDWADNIDLYYPGLEDDWEDEDEDEDYDDIDWYSPSWEEEEPEDRGSCNVPTDDSWNGYSYRG